MSRHRNIANYDYEEDLLSDEDQDYYGKSLDEDSPLTPGASQYLYKRNREASTRVSTSVDDFIEEEYPNDHDDDLFQLDGAKPKPKFQIGGPSSSKKPDPSPSRQKPAPGPSGASLGPAAVVPAIQQLRVSEQKPVQRHNSKSPARMTPNASFQKLSAVETAIAATPTFKRREKPKTAKDSINLVVVGHVDAGKSTLMGHLLFELGCVDQKTLNRYRQEADRLGKASFFYAWVLDMTEEERSRGVTMDIARAYFETEKRRINILDAPGHKDFIPNMITGASQSDAALLVVNATTGEFETGFDQGGQTREHALLLRSLGVTQLIVAVNKLDTVDWAKNRFEQIEAVLRTFLHRQAGFSKITFVPVSGLTGDNLTKKVKEGHPLRSYYNGPTLIEALEQLATPERPENLPLRMVVNDVLKQSSNLISLSCKIEAGHVEAGDKIFLMPRADPVVVKTVCIDDSNALGPPNASNSSEICFAGDQILISLSGSFENDSISPGFVICRGGPDCLVPCKKIGARIVVFDILMPIIRGTKVELFAHSMCAPATISLLKCTLNKANGEILKQKPRSESPITNWTKEYDRSFAEFALDFASAAYAPDPLPCLQKHQARLVKRVQISCDYVHDECWAYLAVSDDWIVMAVRGTRTKLQLITELVETMSAPKKEFPAGGAVQRYFFAALEAIWKTGFGSTLRELKKNCTQCKVLFTGHSLGGALASLGSSMFAFKNQDIVNPKDLFLITFGQPRVGNMDYARSHDLLVPNSWRLIHRYDIIWYPEDMDNTTSIYKICIGRPTNEDQDCSNGYYIHYRISDHLVYLGKDVSGYGNSGCINPDPQMLSKMITNKTKP